MAPKAVLLSRGKRFRDPEHGPCSVLEQWTFYDNQKPKPGKWAWCYFRVDGLDVEDDVLNDPDKWTDEVPAIKKRLSSEVRAFIMRPLPELSPLFAATPALRLASFDRPPLMWAPSSWKNSSFAKKLEESSKKVFKAASKYADKVAESLVQKEEKTRSSMKDATRNIGLIGDFVRSSLKPARPSHIAESERSEIVTPALFMSDNVGFIFEANLAMCGFQEDASTGQWTPHNEEAALNFLKASNMPQGVHVVKRMWPRKPLDVKDFTLPSSVVDPQGVCDTKIYEVASSELGDENTTDANGLLLPAWMLRNKIEDI